MFRRLLNRKLFILVACMAAVAALSLPVATRTSKADDLSGIELMQVARVAQGAAEYDGLQYLTARSHGFVNVGPFAGGVMAGGGGAGGMLAGQVEVQVNVADYQDHDLRRRLDVTTTGPMMGATYIVYTGNEGGGQFLGNIFRINNIWVARQWSLMGFETMNRAADGNLPALRQRDDMYNGQPHYVVDVRFPMNDSVRFWINKRTFLTSRLVTRWNGVIQVEEDRSDYRKVSCLMLPFRIVTKLSGQRMADLTVDSYDISTVVPAARFTMVPME